MGKKTGNIQTLKIVCYLKMFSKCSLAAFDLLDIGLVIFTLQYLTKMCE